MISRVVSITLALMISCNLATLAQAQSVEQLLRLQSNPSLAQQLQDQIGTNGKERGTPEVGVPTSRETQVLNTYDALSDPGLLTQSTAPQTSEESVTQRYYRILASEILAIYGAREFAQSQNPELLFFNTMGKE